MSHPSILATKAVLALPLYRHCELCERRCGVNRLVQERGFCRATADARVWRYWVDYAEERELIPSLLVYLSGCDLRCDFCISEVNAFDPRRGVPLTGALLRQIIDWGVEQGARTLQWIGGEPNIHVPVILQAMAQCQRLLPVVWKSDFFGTPQVWDLLQDVVDIYVADFKFGNDDCASRIAAADNYVKVVTRNLLRVAPRGRLIVRHLLLPSHHECCLRPILAWMHEHMRHVPLSLRDGYLPRWKAHRHSELSRPLEPAALPAALKIVAEYGLKLVDEPGIVEHILERQ